jgi:nucleoside-diphosphate-sugar epimerase
MKVLVTGGTGLIGVYTIVSLLDRGHSVRALVRDAEKLARCLQPFDIDPGEVEIAVGDITDRESVEAALSGCDSLIHSAGVFSNKLSDAEWLRSTNVEGTDTVLNCAVDAGLDPVVHVSSYLALFPPRSNPQSADDPVTEPRAMYARTKAAAERIARGLQDRGAPVVTVYPTSVQGPHDPTYGVGSRLIEEAIRSRRCLAVKGTGRGYTDVRDLAQLLARCIQPGLGPRRYMAAGYYLQDDALVKLLSDISGRDIQPIRISGWLIRLLGSLADFVSKLSGKEFQLTREAAEVLSLSVPCDDRPALEELGLELIGVEQSFYDLIQWMVDSGRLDSNRIKPMLPGNLA